MIRKRRKTNWKNRIAPFLLIGCFLLLLSAIDYAFFEKKTFLHIPGIEKQLFMEASENEENFKKEEKLTLLMVGDALIHGAVYQDAKTKGGYDFTPMFENVKEMFVGYDLLFYNQESILGGEELGLSSYPCFNSPYQVGDAFRMMGFNLVSLANNHTVDRGEKAVINSKNYWNQFPEVVTSGSYRSYQEKEQIKIEEKNGITYALLSYTDTTNGIPTPKGKSYLVHRYNEEEVKQDIEKIRDKVDFLMVSMHFGTEYSHTPDRRQKEIAAFLENLGVDLIIGHHPHVVQPIEFINDTPVIYSLGNFISAQRGVEKLTGLVTSLAIKKTTEREDIKIELENITAELVYTSSKSINGGRFDFRLYRYQDLTEEILPNYQEYQKKFLHIVTGENPKIETR